MNRTYPSTWLRPLDLLFYQNVKGTPPKSDYYPMFLELAARVIFCNTIKIRFLTLKTTKCYYCKTRQGRQFLNGSPTYQKRPHQNNRFDTALFVFADLNRYSNIVSFKTVLKCRNVHFRF